VKRPSLRRSRVEEPPLEVLYAPAPVEHVARASRARITRPEWSRDPAAPSLTLFAALIVAGFVAIILGWKVAARTLYVYAQIPAIVSGAVGGVVLIAIGAGMANIQAGRRLAAAERAETELLLDEASALVAAVKARRS